MTITEFLLARIDEDEAIAHSFDADPRGIFEKHGGSRVRWYALMQGRPYQEGRARVLAECEAKRAIVAEHALTDYDGTPSCWLCAPEYSWGKEPDPGPCATVSALAAIFKDHADYREEWQHATSY